MYNVFHDVFPIISILERKKRNKKNLSFSIFLRYVIDTWIAKLWSILMENGLKIKFYNVGVNFICFSSRVTALAGNLDFKRQLSITAFKVSFLE